MNRYLSTVCLTMSGLLVSAHAGMYDRFLENMVSFRALLVVLVIVHILIWLILRLKAPSRNRYVMQYKSGLRAIVKRICKYPVVRIIFAWLLSSVTLGIYLDLIAEQIFFLGGIVILVAWIVYIIIATKGKWRRRFLTGYRALYYYSQTLAIQVVGIIIYLFICKFEWFKDSLSYADDDGFGVLMIEPQPLEILRLCNGVLIISIMFSFAFIIPLIKLGVKRIKTLRKD